MCSGWIEWTMKWSFFACRDVLNSRVWSGCKCHLVPVDRPYRMHVGAEGVKEEFPRDVGGAGTGGTGSALLASARVLPRPTDSLRLVQAAALVREAVGDANLRGPRLSCTLDR
jgi:hypothetical protein